MIESPVKVTSKRGRPYRARFCACGAEATCVQQTVRRSLGSRKQKITYGPAVLLCERCSRKGQVQR